MKQLFSVLAGIFIILDILLVVLILFLFMQNGSTAAAAPQTSGISYEDNSEEYAAELPRAEYPNVIIAENSAGIQTPTPTPTEEPAHAEEPAPEAEAAPGEGSGQAEQPSAPTPEPPVETPTPTPEPTPEPLPTAEVEVVTEAPAADYSSFVFPNSHAAAITQAELEQTVTDKAIWQRAVNELFARHGYLFHQERNPAEFAYFNSLPWYAAMPKTDSQDAVRAQFNDIERANLRLLVSYQQQKGW